MAIILLLIGTFSMVMSLSPVSAVDTYCCLTIGYDPCPGMPEPDTAPTVGAHDYTVDSVINVTAPLIVNDTTGVQWSFLNWTVTYPDNSTWSTTNNKFPITMNENKTATAYYKVEYLFTVITAYDLPYIWYGSAWHQEATHWFDEYDIAYAGVANEHVDLNVSIKAKFVEWTGDASGKKIVKSGYGINIQTDAINMTGAKTVIANWVIEYFLDKDSVYNPWGPTVPYDPGAYYTALEKAIDRIVLLQKKSSDYGWDWVVTGATGPSGTTYQNLHGVISMGLLCAFELTENITYFFAAQNVADEMATGDPTNGDFWNNGWGYGWDYMFLVEFSEISGRPEYKDYAIDAWDWQKANKGKYADGNQTVLYNDQYNNWVASHGIVIWNSVSYGLGALAVGDTEWAENMTAVIAANFTKIAADGYEYLGWGHALKLFQAVDPTGYATEIASAVNSLKTSQLYSGSWPGNSVQDAAYAVMGLCAVGEMEAAEKGADWLVNQQLASGGWLEPNSKEYAETDSEAAQALCCVAKCWYAECTYVDLTAPEFVNVKDKKWRWRFDYWTVEKWNGTHWMNPQNFTTRPITVHMDMPTKATVHFYLQYYMAVSDSPSMLDTGVESFSGYYDFCSNLTLTAPLTVPDPSDPNIRWIFNRWYIAGVIDWYNNTFTVHVEAAHSGATGQTIYAIYTKEFYLEVNDDIGGLSGVSTQSGWFTPGTVVPLSAPYIIPVDSGTRYAFVEWIKNPGHYTDSNCNTTITMATPRNATAYYTKQYKGTWEADPTLTGIVNLNTWNAWSATGGSGWFDANAKYWWSCKSGPAPGSPFDYYFDHWTLNGGVQTQFANSLQINFTGPVNGIANYLGKSAFYITPQTVIVDAPAACTTFEVNVTAANLVDLYGVDFKVTWDPTLIELVDVDVEVDEIWTQYFIGKNEYNNTVGWYHLVATSLDGAPNDPYGFNGTHKIVKLTFHIIYDPCYISTDYEVHTNIGLTVISLADSNGNQIGPWNIHGGYYQINAVQPKIEMRPAVATASQKDCVFTVEIWIVDAVKLHDYWFKIDFNTNHLDIIGVEIDTTFLTGPYEMFYYEKNDASGWIEIKVTQQQPGETLAYGEGRLVTLTFKVHDTLFWTTSNPTLNSWISFSILRISVKCPNYHMIYASLLDYNNCEYKYLPIPGDVNMDGVVNVLDLKLVAADYGSTTTYDLDEDADVDLIDLVLVAINYGRDEP